MGFIRFLLAMAVVFQHYGKPGLIDAGVAVYFFFMISGFYIALVYNEKYQKLPLRIFYLSRYLRLLPLFLTSNLILLISAYLGKNQSFVSAWNELSFMQKPFALIPNLTMLGTNLFSSFSVFQGNFSISEFGIDPLHNGSHLLLNPPSWTVSVELLFYFTAPFFILSFKKVAAGFLVGAMYYILLQLAPTHIVSAFRVDTYFLYYIPYFCLGIFSYFLYQKNFELNNKFYLLCIGLASIGLLAKLNQGSVQYILFCFSLPLIFSITKNNLADRWIGELSYPIYMLHWPLMLAPLHFGVKIIVLVGISALAVVLIDMPISKYRSILLSVRTPTSI